MPARRRGIDRLHPMFIATHAPVSGPYSSTVTSVIAVGVLAVIAVLVLLLSYSVWHPWGPVAAAVPLGVATQAAWPYSRIQVFKKLNHGWLRSAREQLLMWEGPYGKPVKAVTLRAGTWFTTEKDQKERERLYRKRTGNRSSILFAAEYRLVIAVVEVNGIRSDIAYSTGASDVVSPMANILEAPMGDLPTVQRSDPDLEQLDGIASALCAVVRLLYESEQEWHYTRDLVSTLDGVRSTREIVRALHAAEWWGLIRVGRDDQQHFYEFPVEITPAGQVWHEASDEVQIERAKVRSQQLKDPGRAPSFVFNGDFTGVINYAGRDLHDVTSSVRKDGPSREEIMSALRHVLNDERVPWSAPAMQAPRKQFEEALRTGSVEQPRLRAAVDKLFAVCASLGMSVAGNAAYEILKRLVS